MLALPKFFKMSNSFDAERAGIGAPLLSVATVTQENVFIRKKL